MTTIAKPVQRYKVILYTPHPGQVTVHQSKARFRVVNCGRRWGKTFFACNEEVKFALDNAGVLCWWVAPVYRQAKIAYRLMKKALKEVLFHQSDTDLRLELINGSVIECRSCDSPDNLRGEGIHFLVVEEAAMLPDDTWFKVLRPMLSDTNGRAIFISTPKGHNWFYTMYQRGLDPLQKDYESFTRPTSNNPYIDPEEIEDAKRDLPEDVYEQEYLAVFKDSSAGAFRNIDACVQGELHEPEPGITYEVGFDVAKHQDYSVMTVFNTATQHVDWWHRLNHTDYVEQIEDLKEITINYNNAHVLMDCTGVGAAVMEMAKSKDINVDGYLYTNTSKTALIGELIVAIQHISLTFPDIPVLVGELRAMQRKYTPSGLIQYEAPSGGTDDFVNSLALSYHAGATAMAIPLAVSGQSRQQEGIPQKHDVNDEAIMKRQEMASRILGEIQLTGQFGR